MSDSKPEKDVSEVYWCLSHEREATHTDKSGERRCDPKLGGILLPCSVVKRDDDETA